MRRRSLLAALPAVVAANVALGAETAPAPSPPLGIDGRITRLMRDVGVPGAALAIVQGTEIKLARGYGVRRLGSAPRVDENTIFEIGSDTKAFTAAAIAILADAGRLSLDDHVIDHMPTFQMFDPWVTREITVRDLLVHRSGFGLGAGDLLFVPHTDFGREQIVERLRFIRPATSFRSGYAYDNVLYIAAGALIEKVSGQSWEAFVRANVLTPAGITNATVSNDERFHNPNRAAPHARVNGPLRGLGEQSALDERASAFAQNMAPAGMIAASARDMARWLLLQLGKGATPEGRRVYSAAMAEEMWRPHTLIPIDQLPAPVSEATPQFQAYALGWEVRSYRGHTLIGHGGGVFGSISYVLLIPERDVGIAMMCNCEDSAFTRTLAFELADHYLGLAPRDWERGWRAIDQAQEDAAREAIAAPQNAPVQVGPSLALARYAGDYDDPWYGRVRIDTAGDGLRMTFSRSPGMTGPLTHWQYDTFKVVWDDHAVEPAFVTFALDVDGKVARMSMRAVSPLADFSFDYQDLDFRPAALR